MEFRTRAPAKINLTLHVLGRRPDGYHELESVVAFAGVADVLVLTPGAATSLDVAGPTAAAAGPPPDNLVLRAVRALQARVPGLCTGAFRLFKRLPVGAGIGGGSSDAAAALRLLARLNGFPCDDVRVHEAACETGADVPVCVDPRSRVMCGVGDRLGPALRLPPAFAVLANPGLPLETRAVFAAMGLKPGLVRGLQDRPQPSSERDFEGLVAELARGRNDMERAAAELAPVVAHVLAALRATPLCALARMSGSGSTCFGLFAGRHEALGAAVAIRAEHPAWWVRATALR